MPQPVGGFHDDSGFSLNDFVGARSLQLADFLHSHDFPSPFSLCTVVSHATDIRIAIPRRFKASELEEFLTAFPRVTRLFVRGDPLPGSFKLSSELLPQVVELDGPFSETSAVFSAGRPVKLVRLYQPLDQENPSVEAAQTLSAGLLQSTASVDHLAFRGLRVAEYVLVLPAFRQNFRLLRKLHIVSDDDEMGMILLEWITREMGSHLPLLESLIIGNEHLLPNGGPFTRTSPALPDTVHCLTHVLALSESCPQLRYVLLPGRSYTYRARGDWACQTGALDDAE